MRTLATFLCGLALSSLILPDSTVGQESFRRAMIEAGKSAVTEGKITRRDLWDIRKAMLFPRTRNAIQGMVIQEAWLSGAIPDAFTTDGKYDASQLNWGDGALLKILLDNLPQIIEFVKALTDIFGGFAATDGSMDGPELTDDPDSQAAQAMLHNVAARLATNFETIRTNAEAEAFTLNGLNSAVTRAIDDAFNKSKTEFQTYSQPRFINAQDPLPVLNQFVLGFGG